MDVGAHDNQINKEEEMNCHSCKEKILNTPTGDDVNQPFIFIGKGLGAYKAYERLYFHTTCFIAIAGQEQCDKIPPVIIPHESKMTFSEMFESKRKEFHKRKMKERGEKEKWKL